MKESHQYLTVPSPPNVTVVVAPSTTAPLPNRLRRALTSCESPLPQPTPAGHRRHPPRKRPSNPSMVRGNGPLLLYRCVISLLGARVPAEAESEMVSACAW